MLAALIMELRYIKKSVNHSKANGAIQENPAVFYNQLIEAFCKNTNL